MKSKLLSLLIAVLAITSLASHAGFFSARTIGLLTAAGFRQQAPETAEQKELYGNMRTDSVQRVEFGGKVFYAYKEDRNSVPYVGDEENHERYKKLVLQQQQEIQAEQQRQRNRMSMF